MLWLTKPAVPQKKTGLNKKNEKAAAKKRRERERYNRQEYTAKKKKTCSICGCGCGDTGLQETTNSALQLYYGS